jgi:hypothetical protein
MHQLTARRVLDDAGRVDEPVSQHPNWKEQQSWD